VDKKTRNVDIECLSHFYVRKFVMCVCAYVASNFLTNLVNAILKCLCFKLLIVGVCNWELLCLKSVYYPTK
jgi:hypothetical protein